MNPELSSSIFTLGVGFSTIVAHNLYYRNKNNKIINNQENNNNIYEDSSKNNEIENDNKNKDKEENNNLKKCKIYYASQTGTAERYSRILSQKLSQLTNISESNPKNLEDFIEEDFYEQDSVFIFLIATHYDGLYPDNTRNFVKFVKKLAKSERTLENLRFCIFGLGSSDYDYFNEAAKDLQNTLKFLKSSEFSPIYLCDELKGVGREFDRWLVQLLKSLSELYGINIDKSLLKSSEKDCYKSWRYLCDLELRYVNIDIKSNFEAVANDIICKQQYQCVDTEVLENYNLIPETDQVVNHIVFGYNGEYKISDTAYVLYRNPRNVVEFFMDKLNLTEEDLDKTITFVPRYGNVNEKVTFSAPFPIPVTIRDALELYCDLTSLPDEDNIMKLCSFIKNKEDVDRIDGLVRNNKIMKHIRDEVQLTLHEFIILFFPDVKFNLSGFLQLIPKQIPKPYTISSEPNNHNFSITVKLTQHNLHSLKTFYKTYSKKGIFNEKVPNSELFKRRVYKGNCSRYLCSLRVGESVKFFIRTSSFSTVDLNRPLLLISNGTGIAAFRGMWRKFMGFNEHEKTNGIENNQNGIFHNDDYKHGDRILVLGFRTGKHVLYREELSKLSKTNVARILYAFSREQNNMYAQQLIKTQLSLVQDIIDKKGVICICGSRRMGNEIKLILKNYIESFNLEELKANNQFIEELW